MPETVGAFAAFLALVAPGLVFELLRERRRPSISETAFREASRIALASLVFTGVAVGALVLVRFVVPSWVVDPGEWLRAGDAYVRSHYRLIARTFALELLIACAAAVAVDWSLRSSARGDIVAGSIWFQVFRQRRPTDSSAWVHVRLSDETEVWGYVGDYTTDAALEDRELTLGGPDLQYRRKGAAANEVLSPKWSFVCVRGDQVTWMKVAYVHNAHGTVLTPKNLKRGWWRRKYRT